MICWKISATMKYIIDVSVSHSSNLFSCRETLWALFSIRNHVCAVYTGPTGTPSTSGYVWFAALDVRRQVLPRCDAEFIETLWNDHTSGSGTVGQFIPRDDQTIEFAGEFRVRSLSSLCLGLPRPVHSHSIQQLPSEVYQVRALVGVRFSTLII